MVGILRVAGVTFALALAAACGGSSSSSTLTSANVAGAYTVDVTNTSNGCNLGNWMDNAMSTGIPVTVAQNGTQLTATVAGLVGTFLNLGLGTNTFTGSLIGESATMNATGSVQGTQGSCTFTTNATIQASFSGDTMQGTVTYTRVPVGTNSSCAALQGCMSVQNFSGVRPPGSH